MSKKTTRPARKPSPRFQKAQERLNDIVYEDGIKDAERLKRIREAIGNVFEGALRDLDNGTVREVLRALLVTATVSQRKLIAEIDACDDALVAEVEGMLERRRAAAGAEREVRRSNTSSEAKG